MVPSSDAATPHEVVGKVMVAVMVAKKCNELKKAKKKRKLARSYSVGGADGRTALLVRVFVAVVAMVM